MKSTLWEKERPCTQSATSVMTRLSWSGTRISMTRMMFTLALSSKSSLPVNPEKLTIQEVVPPYYIATRYFRHGLFCNSFRKAFFFSQILDFFFFFSIKTCQNLFISSGSKAPGLLHCIDIYSRKRKEKKYIFIVNGSLVSYFFV